MLFKKELRKVFILLGIGLALTLWLVIATMHKYGLDSIRFTDLFDMIIIILYPLGFFYNWRMMFGLATYTSEYVPPSRYYTVAERINFQYSNFTTRILWFALAFTLGWIPGIYIACRNLYYLKKNNV